jgi:DNA mismatch repair protein MutS
MNYNKDIFVKDYFEIHKFYSEIYGYNRTIILMQVGSFHECYCTDTEGLDLINIANSLDIICTKKNGKEPVSKTNPRMVGFPIHVTDNFIEKLCNINFTVIKIDQTSEPPKPKREVVGVFSPATLVEKINSSTKFLVSIVIDKIKNNNLCIGLSSYDLSTGHGTFYETYSNSNDLMLALDDTNRYLETCPPKEIILYSLLDENDKINNMNLNNILDYLNLNKKNIFDYSFKKNNNKIAYQKLLFEKIFLNKNIFESLNLHLYNWARFSLTNLFDYVEQHQTLLIKNLKLPLEFNNKEYLYLGNNCINQLNILNKNVNEKSLFQIINFTKTNLGKRFLIDSLSKPYIDDKILNERYDLIEKIIINKYNNNFSDLLEDISDIEKIVRRLELGNIHPSELYLLYLSFYQINNLFIFCKKNSIFNIDENNNVNEFLNYITNTFELDIINNLNFINFSEFDKNIFKKNKYTEIDNLVDELYYSVNFLDNLINKLSLFVDDKKIFLKKDSKEISNMITLKFNERDGHYLYITNRRCEILKKNLENIKEIEIGKYKINISDFEFIELPKSSYTKINCKKIKEISNELVFQKSKLAKKIKEIFKLECINILDKFNNIFLYWIKKIGYIDFINSGAITSIKNHYYKPNIKKTNDSYFNCVNLRHPIIENISTDIEYKPHSLELGDKNELCGILLYGINSSGKSTLMKSIGLNIILAQIGYFVAAESFTFSPYHSLFTRISGNDNIYRGQSSFMVEMIELTSILKRYNSNTMVLADEVCRGTEEKSANIIVAYMLETLSLSKTTFITATHLHKLTLLPTIQNIKNIKAKHLKVTYDNINDNLIYDRDLSDGQGETFYGLTVAKYLMKDSKFNDITQRILNEYDNYNEPKQSKYNSMNYLIECKICKSKNNLETHHIEFQKDFNLDNVHKNKLHYQKDANYNLVTLCRICHDNVDRNIIIINGWKETINGFELDYNLNDEVLKKNKYDVELLNYIKLLKDENIDAKFARIKIKEKLNKKISKKSILKLWS